ncbi:MAG: M14 family zinc carboxypeptidase, partial [Siphonobacter sp.]
TPTYAEGMAYFRLLDQKFPQMQMRTMGQTDSGEPLSLIILSNDQQFDLALQRKKGKTILLIDNAIHPGEPDGVDACQVLLRDLLTHKNGMQLPDNLVLCVIPFYNIDGSLNRNSYSRANQTGPNSYGFRANGQNYDLNRDFVKADSRNAQAFTEIFHLADPDVFVDTHVSNGADYQHIMTLITTQHSKLGGSLGNFLHTEMEPYLYQKMKEKGFPMTPYVTNFGPNVTKEGFSGFIDYPRYSTGFAAMFQTIGFMPETHMLKAYALRVQSTYELLRICIDFTSINAQKIRTLRREAREAVKTQTEFPLAWKKDTTRFNTIEFLGYEHGYRPSEVSGQPRLYYDRAKPFMLKVPYYDYFIPTITAKRPDAYIISQAWWPVIDRLKMNQVQMKRLEHDTTLTVDAYRIESYQTSPRAYEGHYPHTDVKVSTTPQTIHFWKGDYYIPCNQTANRYIVETLEPTSPEGFFAWNFFDSILQQKEGYSDYVFEDLAAEHLKANPDLRKKLEQKRNEDPAFAKNGRAQLNFVYQNSPYYEPEHMRYPVFRVVK